MNRADEQFERFRVFGVELLGYHLTVTVWSEPSHMGVDFRLWARTG